VSDEQVRGIRTFVAMTGTAVAELRAAALTGLVQVAPMIDSVQFGESVWIVAVGIDKQGTEHPPAGGGAVRPDLLRSWASGAHRARSPTTTGKIERRPRCRRSLSDRLEAARTHIDVEERAWVSLS
jgi:hypothetical protein